MDTRVAKRYARALFGVAKVEGIVSSVDDDLQGICATIRSNDRFRTIIYGPNFPREEKLGLMDRVFSDRVTALSMHLVRLLLEKRREHELEFIRLEFSSLRREDERILFAQVTSAEELSDDQKNAIISRIGSATGRKVEASFSIDGRVMGGVKVAYDNYVLDGTVRGHLNRLREKLLLDVLKQG